MEKKLREYEKEIIKLTESGKLTPTQLERHWRMVVAFQHERLIHLLVTLFFALVTILMLAVSLALSFVVPMWPYLVPLYVLDVILVVLTGAYVKHYYYLENHVQKLYFIDKKA
ncbi:hypothetical protein IKF76_00625 [Candidatus Saccharibacteria bacterium]|nr:hypothetical protein [Candidatus Saccharibacteria bacterium]